jgi:hypothetical protein
MMARENEKPMTMIRRESSMRPVIICRPLLRMKAAVKNNVAPITGAGMAATAAAAAGNNANRANMAPMA